MKTVYLKRFHLTRRYKRAGFETCRRMHKSGTVTMCQMRPEPVS